MNHSIITQYHEEIQFSPSTLVSQHLVSKSPEKHGEDIYAVKLQAKIKQIKNSIRKNKPLIQQLKAQRKFLKKIYQKQKQKIEGTKVELIKAEYQNQIDQLRMERHKLQDVIAVIHEQSGSKAKDFVEAKQQINLNYLQLSRVLQQVKAENQMYSALLVKKTETIDIKSKLIQDLNFEIKSKLNIQRRYRQIMEQINQIQLQKKF